MTSASLSRKVLLIGFASGLALLASTREAAAYPQFQFSSGTSRCGQCHYSPSGGTLITSWGRDESGDTISLGGDGNLLHGLWSPPSWLALGGDVRLAALSNNVGGPESPEVAAFPMQFDLYGRVAYDAFSLNVTLGDRGVVRPPDPSLSGRSSDFVARLVSREHYVMWRPSATGPYARVGRFAAPYGLRFVEHIYFVRRYTGYNLYEETYNASGGYVADDWELHVTAFTHVPTSFPDLLGAVGPAENGGVVYGEKRFNNMAAIALQARVGIAPEEARYQGGAVGKLWFEPARLLFLGEADFIRQQLTGASFGQNQFVSYIGATYVMRGLMAGVAYERLQENLSVRNTGRNALDGEVNFFPWAHIEVGLLGRYEPKGAAGATQNGSTASLGMLQLHYYL
jgi:hypothetical protein